MGNFGSGTPVVVVEGLTKRYGAQAVVDDLTLQIHAGECFALLGPNGAGKTTTIEMMQGVRAPTAGSVRVLGEGPAHGSRRWRSRIGVVEQTLSQGLDLRVDEMVDHFAGYHANPYRSQELLETVDLVDSTKVLVPNLSGGQRRRLEVALAIQGHPELLFLDEPTTGLDPVARRSFWALVEQLRAARTTIVLTTHYLDEAEHLADRVGVIAAGRLQVVAPPSQIGARLGLPTRIEYRLGGQLRSCSTTEPVAELRSLLDAHPVGQITELDVHRPNLEDNYLALIGAPLPARDAS